MKDKLEKAMLSLKSGDNDALETIYNLTYRGVYSFVFPILKDYMASEDILQMTYISVFEKASQYKEGTSVLNWILTIAKNLALNEFNKNKRSIDYDYDAEQATPSNLYSFDESLDTPTIELASEILSEEDFKILIMYVVGGYKHREIAELLDLPLGTVTWKYKASLDKLRVELERIERHGKERLRNEA